MGLYRCVGKHNGHDFSFCEECFRKQLIIDRQKEELDQLRGQLRYRKTKGEYSAIFGSSTPSSKIEIKASSGSADQKKQGGAPKGREGFGRQQFEAKEADEVHRLKVDEKDCPECGGKLESRGIEARCVVDALLTEAKRVLYECQVKQCQSCKKQISRKPLVQPGFLYGNGLISNAIVDHLASGIPLRKVAQIFGKGVSSGALIRIFHGLAKKWEPAVKQLEKEYRASELRHADETGWRTDGKNGYAWLFCTPEISLFHFGKSRSSETPRSVLGTDPLNGVLVVDRYGGYNQMPCPIQYCYAHLLRDLQDIEKKFPKNKEAKVFVETLAPLFADAMKLRREAASDELYYREAKQIQAQMLLHCRGPAKNLAIQTFQNLILDNQHRLFHWVTNRQIPPDNNRAEGELRPTVIARKMSFGSQSQKGAETRSILMSVIHTAAKRLEKQSLRQWFFSTLEALAKDPNVDLFQLIPKS
jgi:transposase